MTEIDPAADTVDTAPATVDTTAPEPVTVNLSAEEDLALIEQAGEGAAPTHAAFAAVARQLRAQNDLVNQLAGRQA